MSHELKYTRIIIVAPVHAELDLLELVQPSPALNQCNNEANILSIFGAQISFHSTSYFILEVIIQWKFLFMLVKSQIFSGKEGRGVKG